MRRTISGLKDFWSSAERELYTLLHCPKGHHTQLLPALLGSSPGRERKPRAVEGLPAGMMLPWESRR